MSARLLVDPQTPLGDADLDRHVAGGSTRSEGTPARLLPSLETGTKASQSTWRKDATAHDGCTTMMMMMIAG